jgi:outer membrane lipoprotein
MVDNGSKGLLFVVFLLLLISGCAHPISSDIRQNVSKDLTFPVVLENPSAYIGSMVIWGGEISETSDAEDGTLITLVESPLDVRGRPLADAKSRGMFLAKSSKHLDPEVYRKGKAVTLAGDIIGTETVQVHSGEMPYVYPVLQIRELHLWREKRYKYHGWHDSPPYSRGYNWGLGL